MPDQKCSPLSIFVFSLCALLTAIAIFIRYVFVSKKNAMMDRGVFYSKTLSLNDTREVIKSWGRDGVWALTNSDIDPPLFVSSDDFAVELTDICLTFPLHPVYRTGCGTDASRTVLDYRWQSRPLHESLSDGSSIPPFPPWDRVKACSLLSNKFVVVVGDSLSGSFFFTLNSALREDQNKSSNLLASETEPLIRLLCKVCTDTGENFVKLKFLGFPLPPLEPGISLLPDFFDVMKEADNLGYIPQNIVFVVNWGHWFLRGEPFVADSIIKRILWGLKLLRDVAPDSIIFWRTTPGGHPDAHFDVEFKDDPPLLDPLNRSSYYFDGPRSNPITEGWWVLEQFQPTLTAAILLQDPNIFILDVVPATRLRHDSHPKLFDGLHYCVPGPVDFWVRYFLSSLELIYA